MMAPVVAFASLSSLPSLISQYPLTVPSTRRHANLRLRGQPTALLSKTNRLEETNTNDGHGLYIHIPYCRRRCRYCDFAIVPVGTGATTSDDKRSRSSNVKAVDGFRKMDDRYRTALLRELDLVGKAHKRQHIHGEKIPLRSIYFGGGTPSLAPTSTLRSILSAVLSSEDGPFYANDGIEITIEMDPGTFSEDKLRELRDAGFNRISLGVQSFDDHILSSIGRVHRRQDVLQSIDMIRRVFVDDEDGEAADNSSSRSFSYSVDLISGLPNLSLAKWTETLETAVNLNPKPDHLSLYDLQVEEGTVFGKWYGADDQEYEDSDSDILARTRSAPSLAGKFGEEAPPLPTPDECAYMYRYASGYLCSRGYEHYEISSYARPGKASKHNQIYWEIGSSWYSIGLGATSSIQGSRFARPRNMADYIDWVKQQDIVLNTDGDGVPSWLCANAGSSEDVSDFLTDVIMTKLRTKEGLDLNWVRTDPVGGEAKADAVLRGADLALEMDLAIREHTSDHGHDYLRLTDPDGFLFSNNIISQIFVELDELAE